MGPGGIHHVLLCQEGIHYLGRIKDFGWVDDGRPVSERGEVS